MLNMGLVEAPTKKPTRTSVFQAVVGRPMSLDMTTTDHTDQSVLKTKAICRVRGDLLTYCVGAPGQPRPLSFTTMSYDGNTLVRLRRRSPAP